MRLTQASTNYVAMGEAGFLALTRLRAQVPAVALDYPDGEAGVAAVEAFGRHCERGPDAGRAAAGPPGG